MTGVFLPLSLALRFPRLFAALLSALAAVRSHARCMRWALVGLVFGLGASLAHASGSGPVSELPAELHPLAAFIQIAGMPGAIAFAAYHLGRAFSILADRLDGWRLPVHIHLTTEPRTTADEEPDR